MSLMPGTSKKRSRSSSPTQQMAIEGNEGNGENEEEIGYKKAVQLFMSTFDMKAKPYLAYIKRYSSNPLPGTEGTQVGNTAETPADATETPAAMDVEITTETPADATETPAGDAETMQRLVKHFDGISKASQELVKKLIEFTMKGDDETSRASRALEVSRYFVQALCSYTHQVVAYLWIKFRDYFISSKLYERVAEKLNLDQTGFIAYFNQNINWTTFEYDITVLPNDKHSFPIIANLSDKESPNIMSLVTKRKCSKSITEFCNSMNRFVIVDIMNHCLGGARYKELVNKLREWLGEDSSMSFETFVTQVKSEMSSQLSLKLYGILAGYLAFSAKGSEEFRIPSVRHIQKAVVSNGSIDVNVALEVASYAFTYGLVQKGLVAIDEGDLAKPKTVGWDQFKELPINVNLTPRPLDNDNISFEKYLAGEMVLQGHGKTKKGTKGTKGTQDTQGTKRTKHTKGSKKESQFQAALPAQFQAVLSTELQAAQALNSMKSGQPSCITATEEMELGDDGDVGGMDMLSLDEGLDQTEMEVDYERYDNNGDRQFEVPQQRSSIKLIDELSSWIERLSQHTNADVREVIDPNETFTLEMSPPLDPNVQKVDCEFVFNISAMDICGNALNVWPCGRKLSPDLDEPSLLHKIWQKHGTSDHSMLSDEFLENSKSEMNTITIGTEKSTLRSSLYLLTKLIDDSLDGLIEPLFTPEFMQKNNNYNFVVFVPCIVPTILKRLLRPSDQQPIDEYRIDEDDRFSFCLRGECIKRIEQRNFCAPLQTFLNEILKTHFCLLPLKEKMKYDLGNTDFYCQFYEKVLRILKSMDSFPADEEKYKNALGTWIANKEKRSRFLFNHVEFPRSSQAKLQNQILEAIGKAAKQMFSLSEPNIFEKLQLICVENKPSFGSTDASTGVQIFFYSSDYTLKQLQEYQSRCIYALCLLDGKLVNVLPVNFGDKVGDMVVNNTPKTLEYVKSNKVVQEFLEGYKDIFEKWYEELSNKKGEFTSALFETMQIEDNAMLNITYLRNLAGDSEECKVLVNKAIEELGRGFESKLLLKANVDPSTKR